MVVLLRYPRLQVDRQKGETEVEQDEFVCGRIVILIKIIWYLVSIDGTFQNDDDTISLPSYFSVLVYCLRSCSCDKWKRSRSFLEMRRSSTRLGRADSHRTMAGNLPLKHLLPSLRFGMFSIRIGEFIWNGKMIALLKGWDAAHGSVSVRDTKLQPGCRWDTGRKQEHYRSVAIFYLFCL